MEATETAKKKGLCMVSGLAWRYDTGVCETMKRVHDGAIGEIVTIQEICNTGFLRSLPRRPGMTEMEYQIYNWYDFNWLSADLPGLNMVHNVDKGAWALHDEPPLEAWGMGGREVRKGPTFGDCWDHHATVYEYANGARKRLPLPLVRRHLWHAHRLFHFQRNLPRRHNLFLASGSRNQGQNP